MICRNCGHPMAREDRCASCGFDNGAKGLEAVLRELFRMFPREARANLIVLFGDLSGTAVEAKEERMLQLLCSTGSDKRLIRAADEKRASAEIQAEIEGIVRELSEAFYDAAAVRSACNIFVRALSTSAKPEQTAKPQKEQKSGGKNALPSDHPLIKSYYLEKNGALKYCDDLLKIDKGVVTGFASPGAPISKLFLRSGITAIGAKAFENAAIDRVVLPEGLRYIGAFAFAASSITSISLPNSLEYIGSHAFFQCTALKKVDFPKHLSAIGARAFGGTALEEVLLPPGVTDLPDLLFHECGKLKTVQLSPNTRSIGNVAFALSGIERLVIPTTGPLRIHQYAFSGCKKKLEILVPEGFDVSCLPESVRHCARIPNTGSKGSQNVQTGRIAAPQTEWKPQKEWQPAVAMTQPLANGDFRLDGGGWVIIKDGVVTSSFSPVTIKELPLDEGITSIGAYAFRKAKIEQVKLPEGLKKIEYWAFRDAQLRKIELPDSVERIEEEAFAGCEHLNSLHSSLPHHLPMKLEKIGAAAFADTAIPGVVLPPGITDVPERAFHRCSKLSYVWLSPKTRAIEPEAFAQSGIERLIIPTSNRLNIAPDAFSGCKKLKMVYVPKDFDLSCLPAEVRSKAVAKDSLGELKLNYDVALGVR